MGCLSVISVSPEWHLSPAAFSPSEAQVIMLSLNLSVNFSASDAFYI
jgi:hypothetical protein